MSVLENKTGTIHTNNEIYGDKIFLADGMDESTFYEITDEEYNDIKAGKVEGEALQTAEDTYFGTDAEVGKKYLISETTLVNICNFIRDNAWDERIREQLILGDEILSMLETLVSYNYSMGYDAGYGAGSNGEEYNPT